jgi:site-specific recombinase XerD
LRIDEVDLKNRIFKVVIKGGNELPGWFGETTAEYLEAWLRVRMAPPHIKEMFISVGGVRPGTGLTTNGLCSDLRKIGNKAGCKGVTTHAFRRGFAVKLSAIGVPDNILKDFGRWEDVKMIKRYTQAQQVGKLFPQYSPMDNLQNGDEVIDT